MFKKIFAVTALSLSAAVFANGNIPMAPASVASDFDPGFYLGLQGGYGASGWDKVDSQIVLLKSSNANSLTGRVFVGYDFTKNFALEVGYAYFGSKATLTEMYYNTKDGEVRTQAFDLVGKGKIAFLDNFNVYAKLGIGYLMSNGLKSGAGQAAGYVSTNWFTKDKVGNFGAVAGFGLSYYFMPNLWTDISWTRYIVNKKFGVRNGTVYGDYQPDADLYALGLAYKFNF